MIKFPHITDSANAIFAEEKAHWDFIFLRPLLLVFYFFLRFITFPLQYLIHRKPWGFEARLMDRLMAFGIKYFAKTSAVELFMRHVQIEPLLYRHMLSQKGVERQLSGTKLNGIYGDFNVDSLATMVRHNLTVGHDLLSYEIVELFDKKVFLENLAYIRTIKPENHEDLSKEILEENRQHSFQLLGPTSLVILIVTIITLVGDLKTTITALNSFGSDSIMLWCMKHIYAENYSVQCDLDFFMQEGANRGHYNSSAFFSNPSEYLYYHIVFDEVIYEILRTQPTKPSEL